MKLLGLRKTRWGIAMTEYLIILGIVAIAAIAIIGVFGKQIKQAFQSSTAAMAGVSTSNTDYESSAKISQDNMGTFTSKTANNN
jgi:pilus assembly protein Flp/PilA